MKHIESPKKSDFHCHTLCSDGSLSPEALIDYAVSARKQIKVLAITDHDNMHAVAPATSYAKARGYDIRILPGIEFSTHWSHGSCDFSIHIVGLFCNENSPELKSRVDSHLILRKMRVTDISEKLLNCCDIDPRHLSDMTERLEKRGTFVTRKHFSDLLVADGIVADNEEAFDKYLGKTGKAYSKIVFSPIPDVIQTIHQSGGIAILAHPLRYKNMHNKVLRVLAEDFANWGGDGIECGHPNQAMDDRLFIRDIALKYNFLASFGSDFHDLNVPFRSLGSELWLPENVRPVWTHELFEGYYD